MRRGMSLKAKDKVKKATLVGVAVVALTAGTFFGAKELSKVDFKFNQGQQQQQQLGFENYVEIHGDDNKVYIFSDGKFYDKDGNLLGVGTYGNNKIVIFGDNNKVVIVNGTKTEEHKKLQVLRKIIKEL